MSNIGLKIAGFVGVVAVLGGGCAAAYACSDTVKNQVKLRTSSPEDYFQWVCEKNISALADQSEEAYQKVMDRTNGSTATSFSMQYSPSDAAKNLLLENAAGGDEKVTSIIRNIDSVSLAGGAVSENGNLAEQFKLLVNDTEVTTAEATASADDGTLYLRVPELSERWIKMPSEASGTSMDFMINPSQYLSASEYSELITRYLSVPPTHVKNVTIDKKTPVQIADISTDYIAMTTDLTAEELVSIFTEISDRACNDDTLLKISPDPDEFTAAMLELGDRLRDAAEYAEGAGSFSCTTYVDMTGVIRGFYTAPAEGTAFFAAVGMDGDQLAAEVKCSAMNKNLFKLSAQTDRNGTGSFKGSVYASEDDSITFKGDFNDLKIEDKDKNYVSGEVSLSINDSEPFKVTLDADGDGQSAECNVNIDGTDYGTVRVTYSDKSDISIQEPDRSAAYEISDVTGFSIADYTDQNALTNYVSTVLTRIGMDESDAQDTALSVGAMLFMFQ